MTASRRGSVMPLVSVVVRLAVAVALALCSFPALVHLPLLSICVAGTTFLLVVAAALAPKQSSPTVHDRQLDLILAVGVTLVGVSVATTWSVQRPVIAVVASMLLFFTLSLLLVGTRTVWRLWPTTFAWLGAATSGVPMVALCLAALIGTALVAVRRRTFHLNRAELGVPKLWRVAVWVVVLTGISAGAGWGVIA